MRLVSTIFLVSLLSHLLICLSSPSCFFSVLSPSFLFLYRLTSFIALPFPSRCHFTVSPPSSPFHNRNLYKNLPVSTQPYSITALTLNLAISILLTISTTLSQYQLLLLTVLQHPTEPKLWQQKQAHSSKSTNIFQRTSNNALWTSSCNTLSKKGMKLLPIQFEASTAMHSGGPPGGGAGAGGRQ